MQLLFYLLVVAVATVTAASQDDHGDPILFIPGLISSELHLVNDSSHSPCHWSSGETKLWINLWRILCWPSELSLRYDENTKTYSNAEDVETVVEPVESFGGTDAVEDIGIPAYEVPAYKDFIQYFVDRGYTRGGDFRAAPYDWRYAADELERQGYFDNLKQLVETMYDVYKRKVNLIASSMGCPVSHYFLTQYDRTSINQAWKDKHIANYITLAGAWTGGENAALEIGLSGLPLHKLLENVLSDIPNKYLAIIEQLLGDVSKEMISSWQSPIWLFPNSAIWGTEVIVTTTTKNYTANDMQELFAEAGNEFGYEKYMQVRDLNYERGKVPPPNVPTHCYYGVGVDTPQSFDYSGCNNFPDCLEEEIIVKMDPNGDGLVNYKGSTVCLDWANSDYKFESRHFKASHNKILKNTELLKAVSEVVGTTPPSHQDRSSVVEREEL